MIYQKISNKTYSNLARSKNSLPSEKAGRHKSHSGLEKIIFKDIKKKLKFRKNDRLLDIGCGCGPLVDHIIKYCEKKKINLTLCDIPDVINILKKKYSKSKNIIFLNSEFQKNKIKNKFNKILCYSVIQCVNQPVIFYKKTINSLSTDGKALIGDIPNVNKKYRFLKSKFGRKFEEKRLKKKIKIKNFKDFLKSTKQNKLINDDFIKIILNHSRKQGRKSYLMKQPSKLPFSYTREDVLIEEI